MLRLTRIADCHGRRRFRSSSNLVTVSFDLDQPKLQITCKFRIHQKNPSQSMNSPRIIYKKLSKAFSKKERNSDFLGIFLLWFSVGVKGECEGVSPIVMVRAWSLLIFCWSEKCFFCPNLIVRIVISRKTQPPNSVRLVIYWALNQV